MRSFSVLHRLPVRRTAAALTASILLVALTGCGSTDDSAELESTQTAGTTEYPLTLDTPYGSTALEEAPERVVAIGDLDDALALGVIPVGSFKPAGDAEELYDYEQEALEKAKSTSPVKKIDKLFDPYADLDFETIAALDPDVILAAAGASECTRSRIHRIRPPPVVAGHRSPRPPSVRGQDFPAVGHGRAAIRTRDLILLSVPALLPSIPDRGSVRDGGLVQGRVARRSPDILCDWPALSGRLRADRQPFRLSGDRLGPHWPGCLTRACCLARHATAVGCHGEPTRSRA